MSWGNLPERRGRWSRHPLAVVLLAVLAACGSESPTANPQNQRDGARERASRALAHAEMGTTPASGTVAIPPPGYSDGSGVNEGFPDLSPMPLAPDLEPTEAGARNVLLAFVRAIELREFDQAWAMLDETAQARWSKAAFNARFAGLSDIALAVPGGQIDRHQGASLYASEARLTARGSDGRTVELTGTLLLRQVDEGPGTSARETLWQVSDIALAPMK